MSSIIQNDQVFNNEVSFCRVYSKESKRILEERFLANRISYYIDWQDKSFLQRLFGSDKDKIMCTIRINRADVERALELVSGLEDVKIRDFGDRKGRNSKNKPKKK
ncbi:MULTISPECIES: hypothetical protein [unclassified Butyrivibrio]|uniref:hypothetical protein n=1 Tax=unclassified Butyrivibrio TaxID=2639466 RepID=UPI0003B63550|nr:MULTISPECIES: hypothetical protein [unclassified Butyrivibrio]SEL44725.1 hypothetical protein SAMN04487770_11093 [Butyrivibrio sp. ob235]